MMKVGLDKLTKIIIIVGVITVSISAIYYYVFLMPRIQKQMITQQELSNQMGCKKLADEKYRQQLSVEGINPIEPEVKFDERSGACLYKGGHFIISSDGTPIVDYRFITNLDTNEDIVVFQTIATKDGKMVTHGSQEEWDNAVAEFSKIQ